MMFIERNSLLVFLGAFFFYVLMAFGGFFSFLSQYVFFSLSVLLIFFASVFFYLLKSRGSEFGFVFYVLLVFSVFLLIGAVRSYEPVYALEKFDAFIVVTLIACILSGKLISNYGQYRFWHCYLLVSLAILAMTIVFKLKFGLMDRDVRFFLNGPIVFGWLMGFAALVSYVNFLRRQKLHLFLVTVLFSLAVVWTASKGPLVALAFVFFYFSLAHRIGRRYLLLGGFFAIGVAAVFFDVLWAAFLDSRFSGVYRLAQADVTQSDWGSIGIRQAMLFDSLAKILEFPLLGIGLGNYQYDVLFYPHNEHLEVFLELGVFAGFFHIAVVMWMLAKSNVEYRGYILFFLLCTSFSGDIGYLRFVYVLGFLGVILRASCVMKETETVK
ncbi:O-antigen ligase family protein [Marinobacter sp.]|uniref:O-antigen ligase family protein n=1 Tax=Marinobacter sp. TaxID=50741 RepID=UPI002B26676A|nr:O-antigen ligase family protein [Marinobacter sp.]